MAAATAAQATLPAAELLSKARVVQAGLDEAVKVLGELGTTKARIFGQGKYLQQAFDRVRVGADALQFPEGAVLEAFDGADEVMAQFGRMQEPLGNLAHLLGTPRPTVSDDFMKAVAANVAVASDAALTVQHGLGDLPGALSYDDAVKAVRAGAADYGLKHSGLLKELKYAAKAANAGFAGSGDSLSDYFRTVAAKVDA